MHGCCGGVVGDLGDEGVDPGEVASSGWLASLKGYQGYTYLDVRMYTEIEGRPEKTVTKRGITVRLALIPEVIEALRQAEAAARETGLVK